MSLKATESTNDLAMDVQSLGRLHQLARENSPQALKESAKQFEALFINMMLKSMRQATPQGGLFEGKDAEIYTAMFDQQLSQTLAQKGMGLADSLLRQLSHLNITPTEPNKNSDSGVDSPVAVAPDPVRSAPAPVQDFRAKMAVHAQEAERLTGIPAAFILGQAALESGWGQREIKLTDGSPSHNLFGIKATESWKGRVAEVTTTEYVQGVATKVVARFRAYDSPAQSFRDYASLLLNSPRYEQVLSKGQTITGFTQGLQQAGYATDPAYASKLASTIARALKA